MISNVGRLETPLGILKPISMYLKTVPHGRNLDELRVCQLSSITILFIILIGFNILKMD